MVRIWTIIGQAECTNRFKLYGRPNYPWQHLPLADSWFHAGLFPVGYWSSHSTRLFIETLKLKSWNKRKEFPGNWKYRSCHCWLVFKGPSPGAVILIPALLLCKSLTCVYQVSQHHICTFFFFFEWVTCQIVKPSFMSASELAPSKTSQRGQLTMFLS